MDKIRRAVKPHNVCPPETPAAVNHSAPQFIGSGPENPVVTIALKYPIAFLGQEHVTVELRRLKGRDFSRMRRLTAAGVSEDEAMLAIISGLPVEVIQELDGGDYLSLLEATKGFIPARSGRWRRAGPIRRVARIRRGRSPRPAFLPRRAPRDGVRGADQDLVPGRGRDQQDPRPPACGQSDERLWWLAKKQG